MEQNSSTKINWQDILKTGSCQLVGSLESKNGIKRVLTMLVLSLQKTVLILYACFQIKHTKVKNPTSFNSKEYILFLGDWQTLSFFIGVKFLSYVKLRQVYWKMASTISKIDLQRIHKIYPTIKQEHPNYNSFNRVYYKEC